MMQIYTIVGMCGEYSDRRDWDVCSFTDLEQAGLCLKALEKEQEKVRQAYLDDKEYTSRYDPECTSFSGYSSENTYGIIKLPLYCHFDEFQEYLNL